MSKPLLGILLGGALGMIDGISALLYPDTSEMIVSIVIFSTIKGILTGLAAGFFAKKFRSIPLGILVGLGVGLLLSFLAAFPGAENGKHYYFEIMLPGAILGMIVGFATQRAGQREEAVRTA